MSYVCAAMNTCTRNVHEHVGVSYNKIFQITIGHSRYGNNESIINYEAELRVLRYSHRCVREMPSNETKQTNIALIRAYSHAFISDRIRFDRHRMFL